MSFESVKLDVDKRVALRKLIRKWEKLPTDYLTTRKVCELLGFTKYGDVINEHHAGRLDVIDALIGENGYCVYKALLARRGK